MAEIFLRRASGLPAFALRKPFLINTSISATSMERLQTDLGDINVKISRDAIGSVPKLLPKCLNLRRLTAGRREDQRS